MTTKERSTRLTRVIGRITGWLGSFPAIVSSFVVVALWFSGAFFVKDGFGNDSYQLIINTGTTIVTFWMVFIIQNTQNREGRATQAKLDALVKANESIDNRLMGIEEAPERTIKAEQERLRS